MRVEVVAGSGYASAVPPPRTPSRSAFALALLLVSGLAGCSLNRAVLGTERDAGGGLDAPFDAPSDGDIETGDVGDAAIEPDDGGQPDANEIDAAAPLTLDLFAGGTFGRASEASYLTGASTDGTTPFLAWATVDERRIEDRGDGLGPMLLMEGERTNYVLNSRDAAAATWFADGALTPNAGSGPDGAMLADENATALAGRGTQVRGVGVGPGYVAASAWVRRRAGAGPGVAQIAVDSVAAGDATIAVPIGESFSREVVVANISVGSPWFMPWCGASFGGGTNQAVDYLADLHQVEAGGFPSSAIRTTATPATRAADLLSYAVGEYPASFLTSGFEVTVVPDFASNDLGPAEVLAVIGMSVETDGALSLGSGAVLVQSPGTGRVSQAATWSRGQRLTITVRPGESITLAGFSTGDGAYSLTGGAWTPGSLYIGRTAASSQFFGRFGRVVTSL